jgi:hypothetical protein
MRTELTLIVGNQERIPLSHPVQDVSDKLVLVARPGVVAGVSKLQLQPAAAFLQLAAGRVL